MLLTVIVDGVSNSLTIGSSSMSVRVPFSSKYLKPKLPNGTKEVNDWVTGISCSVILPSSSV